MFNKISAILQQRRTITGQHIAKALVVLLGFIHILMSMTFNKFSNEKLDNVDNAHDMPY